MKYVNQTGGRCGKSMEQVFVFLNPTSLEKIVYFETTIYYYSLFINERCNIPRDKGISLSELLASWKKVDVSHRERGAFQMETMASQVGLF